MLVLEGVDLLTLPPTRMTNVLYHVMLRHADEGKREQIISDLELPRPGEVPEEGVWSPEGMASAWD